MNSCADLSKFSLIYPCDDSRTDYDRSADVPAIDMFVLDELGLCEALELKNSALLQLEIFILEIELYYYQK